MQVLVKEIYLDEAFNCRGQGGIPFIDVSELANDIKTQGLIQPITVQPASDVPGGIPAGFKYRVVAGHRRLRAHQVLKAEYIEAYVREGLDDVAARVINLSENFQRKDLNILQEARALEALHKAGVPREHVAKKIGKSGGWVQARYYLLEMPEEIQQEAAAGLIKAQHVIELKQLATKDQQFEAVKKLKDAKLKGEKVPHLGNRKKAAAHVKKERKREELFDCIQVIAKNLGYSLATRVLAWAAGEISTIDLYADIKKLNPDAMLPETI